MRTRSRSTPCRAAAIIPVLAGAMTAAALLAPPVHAAELLKLASWKGEGSVPF